MSGVIGKSTEKKKLEEIRILTSKPKTTEDWQYIHKYVLLQKHLRELVIRWNSIGQQIAIEIFSQLDPISAIKAYESFSIYCKIKESVFLETSIIEKTQVVFPSWTHLNIAEYQEHLHQLQNALEHHLTQQRLSTAWLIKENLQTLLSGCNGKLTEELKNFANDKLGNPSLSDTDLQQQWSILVGELRQIHDLKIHFEDIQNICILLLNLARRNGLKKFRMTQ